MNANLPITTNKWLQVSQQQLKKAEIPSYPLDALLLLENITGYNRAHILAHPEKLLTQKEVEKLQKLLARRIKREPIAYILNNSEFYGNNFFVNKYVLVPRPESEAFLELLKSLQDIESLIDIGCGSGIIGISAKLANCKLRVTLSDISTEALKIAKKNADNLKAEVRILKQNLLGNMPEYYDVMCANLPYVPKDFSLEDELSFEPSIALFSDNNGMDHYQRLWRQVPITHPTYVLTESLNVQHNNQIELAQRAGYSLKMTLGLVQLFQLN